MKGAVFIALNEMIESQYGINTWEELLDEVKPPSNGIYTSTEDYSDDEMTQFVLAISKKLSLESSQVTRLFGKFLFTELNKKYGIFTKLSSSLFEFLVSIENVIHKEVRKLYTNPNLPTLACEIKNENEIIVTYQSPRKLCFLAEGLMFGAANYYKENVVIDHTQCMHDGFDTCTLHIKRVKEEKK